MDATHQRGQAPDQTRCTHPMTGLVDEVPEDLVVIPDDQLCARCITTRTDALNAEYAHLEEPGHQAYVEHEHPWVRVLAHPTLLPHRVSVVCADCETRHDAATTAGALRRAGRTCAAARTR
ncbi:hypothetical protein [Cellulomonas marina]|uniref:Uncharacterized protein n=1 Tax=Cellulomonas marina TaxID=988821 RepID=A0A1I0YXL6_9CELL|nr:hypothetical protein [Cellulomonas marina]GIG28061.1 hypothetical protein Cma02nite_06610 [Cellulomonas marina]SFB17606.1 hypothetical protein SAMN05421867_1094 [Cellulomonas marina]